MRTIGGYRTTTLPLPADRYVCQRCGAVKQRNVIRGPHPRWCRDCREADPLMCQDTTPKDT